MPGRLSGSVEAPLSRPGLEHLRPWGGTKGEERSGATRSHAQRVFQREHGEDGEHRTFPEVSTAWHSDGQPVGGPSRGLGQRWLCRDDRIDPQVQGFLILGGGNRIGAVNREGERAFLIIDP